ncbi:MAG: hypothetical protein EAZ87_00855 [Nostocales cyanobacterium]|nr:MAG: hypothetical protein EAZ87_00855 [Nostocales cyanobacterium]
MQFNQIVTINESGIIANAVNFGMMNDVNKNLLLCQGFVFNYDHQKPKDSTLGILAEIQKSYQSINHPNIHLFVQDYGKGKSHFALVAANYFQKPIDTPENQGILKQLKIAAGNHQGIVEDLTAYKKRNPKHLVICINGKDTFDLRQTFLKSLRQTLETEGITNTLAQQLCQKPLEYLSKLAEEQLEKANQYLDKAGNKFGDINKIIELLTQDNYVVIPIVKEISKHLNDGFAIDFDTDLNIEEILTELIKKLCYGENAKYAGILILFDELNNYLQGWSVDPFSSGGLTLQSITDVCETYKSKIALVCFTQIRPLKSVPNQSQEDYKKLASRLEIAESTYEPASSLELVINGLLSQQVNSNSWNQFLQTWENTLLADSRKSYQDRITTYQEKRWNLGEFHQILTLGCIPLHPLNSYLLCNLDFTQGRTVIQYIKEEVKKFINSQPVEKNGKLNYLPAISLVDAFDSNFSQPEFSRYYTEFKNTKDKISSSITENELAILKAIFLFYVSENKLHKPESEKHEIILSELTGLSVTQTKETLDKLTSERGVINYNRGDNTYRFYSGKNVREIEQELEEEISKKANEISVNIVVKHCEKNTNSFLVTEKVEGKEFIETNKLLDDDEWFFEYKFYSIPEFEQALSGYKTLENIKGKGIFAYIFAETIEELQDIRHRVDQLIANSKYSKNIIAAIPTIPVREICIDLWKINIVKKKINADKDRSETALQVKYQELNDKVTREIKEVINSCTYYSFDISKLTTIERKDPQAIVSHLLQTLYPFIPPIAKNDKMALNSSTGSSVIAYSAKRLLEDNLNPTQFPNQSYHNIINPVFITAWGLFKTSSQQYTVQIPTNKNVKEAWNKISELIGLDHKKQTPINIDRIWKELSQPPFGYNEYTFTMLFVAWLSYHRSQVILQGNFGIPKTKKEQISVEEKPLKDWVTTNVFEKPKDFVNKWILESSKKPRVIPVQVINCPEISTILDYEQAQKLIQEIDNFLNSPTPDPTQLEAVKPKKQQILGGIKKIESWLKPIETAENLADNVSLDSLLNIYPELKVELVKPKTFNLANNSKSSAISGNLDTITVNPTQKQKQRHSNALKIVVDKIEEVVEELSEKSESLKTETEFGSYKVKVENAIEKITQVSLPQHLIDILTNSLQVANRKLNEIQYQSEIKDCLGKIQIRYNSLSNNASQQDYTSAKDYIEELTNNNHLLKQESLYQQIVNDIEIKYQNLSKKITIWEERMIEITKDQALKLSLEVSQQQNRFTQPEDSHKVEQILSQLNQIILQNPQQEKPQQEENTTKKQDDANLTIAKINDQIQAIQSESIENQIIALFKQLPVSRRQEVYQKLATLLNNQEEN